MNRKVIVWIAGIALAVVMGFMIYRIATSKKNKDISEESQNLVNISQVSGGEVTDDCLNEWNDYNKYIEEKMKEASNNLSEKNTHYLLKDINGYIQVFYLDENNQEILYKKTTISTDYLSQEDLEDLETGIEVVGIEELNKILEDFE